MPGGGGVSTPKPDLAVLAAEYRELAETTRRPTAQLAKRYGVSRATAGRWIGHARRDGHLAEYEPTGAHLYHCPNCGWRCKGPHRGEGETP